jgi:F-type H+-transporting ATPase subunit b
MLAILAAEGDLRITPKADELILAAIAFGILVVFLVKKVFPRLQTALAERTKKIQGQLEEAERTKREADEVLEEYRAQLAGARAEVQKIIDEGKRTADALRADLTAKAEQQAQEIVARAQADVASERDRAMQQLRTTLGELSIQLASKVIERELQQPDAARALVDRAIEDLVGARAGNGHGSGENQYGTQSTLGDEGERNG